jgi:murein DD-endopeptidase MepM/ murein hydrolase activator NlpD
VAPPPSTGPADPPAPPPPHVIAAPAGASRVDTIDARGATQTLPGVATVTWPASAFDAPARVTVSATTTADTADDFRHTAVLFEPAELRGYEIRIDTGHTPPKAPVQVAAAIPAELAAAVTSSLDVQAFVQFLEEGGDDSIDAFELVPSAKDPAAGTLTMELPVAAFTASRTADGTYEAVLVLGLTPGAPHEAIAAARALASPAKDGPNECAARFVGTPLKDIMPGSLVVTDRYAPPNHKGVDYRAADGMALSAVDDGVIATSAYQVSKTKKNRFGQPSGWGNYVVLKLNDGNMILYAHLKDGTALPAGSTVSRGDKIGEADSSGGVTGPHLHLEYARSGAAFNGAAKIDPDPCIRASVIVQNWDAMDKIAMSIDGVLYGTTLWSPNQPRPYLALVDTLPPGLHTLTAEYVDDYYHNHPSDACVSVWLGHGWKFTNTNPVEFDDNDTSMTSCWVFAGGPGSWQFVVPATPSPSTSP